MATAAERRAVDEKVFDALHAHYLQDLREFWTRSNFYLVAEAAFLAVWASTDSTDSARTAVATAGIVVAVFWFVVAQASLRWLKDWRRELRDLDRQLHHDPIWDRLEGASRPLLLQPATVTGALPVVVLIGWILLVAIA